MSPTHELFRNIDVPSDAAPEDWPYEAIAAVIERGLIQDWVHLTREMRREPWGPLARKVEDYIAAEQPQGVGSLLLRALASAREAARADERASVAAEVARLIEDSALSTGEFAERIGTSRTRLSTYRTGKVVPSAAMLERMRRVSARSAMGTARRSIGHASEISVRP